MWAAWGPWLCLAGVPIAQVLYVAFLKPQGICLGLPWAFTAISGILALVSASLVILWRLLL
jgi:hypothetical protein